MRRKKTEPQNQHVVSLDTMCEHISKQEVKAQKAGRDSIKYMQCIFMKDNVGKVYKGIVSTVAEYGLHVELIETKTEGLVKSSSLPEGWEADVRGHCFKNPITGQKIKLGDELHVVIDSVDIEKKQIALVIFY